MTKDEQCAVMRNKRDVWTVGTAPYPDAHYAVFPASLIEPCILAGSRPGDVVLDPFAGSGTVAALDSLGKMLISAGYDTTVRIWTVTEQIAAKPGQRVGARKETETRKK